MKQIGKIGKRNIVANKKIFEMFNGLDITYCEVCPILDSMGLLSWQCLFSGSNAHRHSRVSYRSKPEMLYDFNQVAFSCIKSHQFIDSNPEIKEKVFIKLRGKDLL